MDRTTEIEAAFIEHNERLVGYCLTKTQHREDAEDAAQDAWLRTLQYKKPIRNYNAWLPTIVNNALVDRYRKQAGSKRDLCVGAYELLEAHDIPEPQPEMPNQVFARQCLEAAGEAMALLTEPQRETMQLALAGYSHAEAGRATGRTREAMQQLRFRARDRIIKYLREKGLME